MKKRTYSSGFLLFALTLSGAAWAVPERLTDSRAEALSRLFVNTAGALHASAPSASSAYSFVRATGVPPLMAVDAATAPLDSALQFLSVYGALLGVSRPASELQLQRLTTDAAGNRHVHLSQIHNGLPVFGARLVVHLNDRGIYGVNGVFVPDLIGLSAEPDLSSTQAEQRALQAAAKLHPEAQLSVKSSELMVYRSGLIEGHDGKNYLAWVTEVVSARGDVREQLVFNAHGGGLINRINRIHSVLNRAIYTPNQDVPPVLTEGAALATNPVVDDQALQNDDRTAASLPYAGLPTHNLYIFAGGTYALYKNLFGREGYDDGAIAPELQVQKSVYLVNELCPNAYWNGDSTNYCPGFDADDVVSHEWSHAYTEYTHGLVYQYQSGALNEAYSDIFGETYDLVNGIEGPLGLTLTEGEYYENGGSRWVVGEDLSETAASVILRDMWDPDAFGTKVPVAGIEVLQFSPSPGSVITSENYFCGTGDGGGVHTNSGVPNHAFAMLVDGKEFNGVTIPAIGLIKAAQIYFHAATHYQTPTTNFTQHADALEQSCADLSGAPLNDVTGAVSAEVITSADCAAVAAAMLAVEMRQSPKQKCGYLPVLEPEANTPAVCAAGQFEMPDFAEDWESGAVPAGWIQTQNLTGDTEPQPFEWVIADAPAPHSGKAAFADDNGFGSCAPGGDASASWSLTSPEITLTDDASFLKFAHYVQTESGFDGGNLKVSVNGGAFAVVSNQAFVHNPHSSNFSDGPIAPPPVPADPTGLFGGNNTNPLAGEPAWTGSDQGESSGSWGVSIVELSVLGAGAGDKIQFRYDYGQDGCGGNLGWFVDDVAVLHCSATPPKANLPVKTQGRGLLLGAFAPWLLLLLGVFSVGKRIRMI